MSNNVTTLQERQVQGRAMLQTNLSNIMKAVNGDVAKASTFQAAILNMLTDQNLAECSVESIIKNAINIIQLGLNPQKTFGQAYIVPFGSAKDDNGFKQAQLQIGYKGFIAIAYRNGWNFRAIAVYKCDKFSIEFNGLSDKIVYKANYEKQNNEDSKWVWENLRGVIVYARDSKGAEFSEFVPFAKLEKLRLKSQNQKNPNELTFIWAQWAEEMYKAKALKYVATRLPITENMAQAISMENEVYNNENIETVEIISDNSNSLLNEVINLADEKNVPIERILEAFGKTDMSEMAQKDLLTAKKRLEISPKKERVA